LVFDTFRFVTSIAGQSRAKSFGHAERRQAFSLAAIARRADIVSADYTFQACFWLFHVFKEIEIKINSIIQRILILRDSKKKDFWFYAYRSALKKIFVHGLTFSRKEIGFSFGESNKLRYLNLLMNFY
jgi:hypothetical protein